MKTFLIVLLGVCIGGMCGFLEGVQAHKDQADVGSGITDEFRFEAVEDLRVGEFGNSCVAEVRAESGATYKIIVYLKDLEQKVNTGDVWIARTTLTQVSATASQTYWDRGITASVSLPSLQKRERSDLIGMVLSFRKLMLEQYADHDNRGSSFLKAVLFGERTSLNSDTEFYSQIKVSGLAHLVAVSGTHLVIVVSLFEVLLRCLRLPRMAIVSIQAVFILIYLVCAGIPLSALRAACMALISAFALFAQRSSSGVNALGVCLCIMLVLSPINALSISLMLSAGATLGILMFTPLIGYWLVRITKRRSYVTDSISVTLSSGIFTTPLCAATFSQVSLISPLANVFALPLFSLFCGSGLVLSLAAVLLPALFEGLLDFLVELAQVFSEAIALISMAPYAAIPASLDVSVSLFCSVGIGCLIWVAWPTVEKKIGIYVGVSVGIALAIAFGIETCTRENRIIMLDVGQGDSFVVQSEGSTILIDTGTQDSLLLSGLARHGIYRLDMILVTHADDDHCGSLAALKGVVQVDTVVVSRETFSCGCDSCRELLQTAITLVGSEGVKGVEIGDAVRVGVFVYEVISPDKFVDEGGNADSLTGVLSSDIDKDGQAEWNALFCGDLEAEQLSELIKKERLGAVDILKVGHHGSKASLSEETVREMNPSIALISVGENNRYGHPSKEVIDLLNSLYANIYRTSEQGDTVCKIYQDRIVVETMR